MYTSDRSNVEITHSILIFTAVTKIHGDSRKVRHTIKITVKVAVVAKMRIRDYLTVQINVTIIVHAYVRYFRFIRLTTHNKACVLLLSCYFNNNKVVSVMSVASWSAVCPPSMIGAPVVDFNLTQARRK